MSQTIHGLTAAASINDASELPHYNAALSADGNITVLLLFTDRTLTNPTLNNASANVLAVTNGLTADKFNKLVITQPATAATLTILEGKTLTVNKTLTFEGTDGKQHTFPTTDSVLARTDAAQSFTGAQTFANGVVLSAASTGTSLALSGALTTASPTSPLGYATGAGGSVTQGTSKSTAVNLSKTVGQITTHGAALADATTVTFAVQTTIIGAHDRVLVNLVSGGNGAHYLIWAHSPVAGSQFSISIRNVSGSSQTDTLVMEYTIFKGSIT